MSRFFKYIKYCPDVAGPFPDEITEGASDCELELETLIISDSSAEIVTASIEIVTVPPSLLQRCPRALEMRERMEQMRRAMNWMK